MTFLFLSDQIFFDCFRSIISRNKSFLSLKSYIDVNILLRLLLPQRPKNPFFQRFHLFLVRNLKHLLNNPSSPPEYPVPIYSVTSGREKLCLWIFFTRLRPFLKSGGLIFINLCWEFMRKFMICEWNII